MDLVDAEVVEDKMQVKKNTLWMIGIILLIVVGGYFMFSSGNNITSESC